MRITDSPGHIGHMDSVDSTMTLFFGAGTIDDGSIRSDNDNPT